MSSWLCFESYRRAYTNIQRHSGSHQARIRIHRNSELVLEISDPGRALAGNIQEEQEKVRFKELVVSAFLVCRRG